MGIAIDGTPASSGVRDGFSTATIPVTVNVRDSTIVLCVGARDTVDADRVVSSVTFQGSSAGWSERRTDTETVQRNMSTFIWTCVNPAIGAGNIVVTMAGVCTQLAAGAVVMTGVLNSNPIVTTNGLTSVTSGEDPSVTLTISEPGCFAVDALYDTASNVGVSIGPGQTQIFKEPVSSDCAAGSYEGPASSDITMSWINDTSGGGFCMSAIALRPSERHQTRRPRQIGGHA